MTQQKKLLVVVFKTETETEDSRVVSFQRRMRKKRWRKEKFEGFTMIGASKSRNCAILMISCHFFFFFQSHELRMQKKRRWQKWGEGDPGRRRRWRYIKAVIYISCWSRSLKKKQTHAVSSAQMRWDEKSVRLRRDYEGISFDSTWHGSRWIDYPC